MASEKARKRQLECDEDDYGEGADAFDTDATGGIRRGRKEGRRVSGVYREIRSLQCIGSNAVAMESVFGALSLKEVMRAGCISPTWNTIACHELRKRYRHAPFLRLWHSEVAPYGNGLLIHWDLHFHEELLAACQNDEDEPMEEIKSTRGPKISWPGVDSIISIGSRRAFDQFTHEDAKHPFRQDFNYMICGEAIITTPDFSYTGTVDNYFGLNSLVIQSLFVPKSDHISLKAFALESGRDSWEIDQVRTKVEYPVEDTGPGQELKAVLCIHYTENGSSMSFVDNLKKHYPTLAHLSGFAEEIGSNRLSGVGSAVAVGYAMYAGPRAKISIYEVDYEQEDSINILTKMEIQYKSAPNRFCFVLCHDSRNWIEEKDENQTEDEEGWLSSVRPKSKVQEIIADLRSRMPAMPIFGINSFGTVVADTVDKSNSNVKENGEKRLCYGFLMITYE